VNQRFAIGDEGGDLGFDAGDDGFHLAEFRVEVGANGLLLFNQRQRNRERTDLGRIRGGEVCCPFAGGFKVIAIVCGGGNIGEELWQQLVAEAANGKDMVLM
jgi:hypothetical protein